jgi:hypothetical protein
MIDVSVKMESPFYGEFKDKNIPAPRESHMWLRNMPYIGGNHSIILTICLLQNLSRVVQTMPESFSLQRGAFGVGKWVDTVATRIQVDMDQL